MSTTQHPFGPDRKTRVERWEMIATFGAPGDPLTEIARLVVLAANASSDAEMKSLAVQALGLDGNKKTDRQRARLREAIDEFALIVGAVYPPSDPETGDTPYGPADAGPEAHARLDAVLAEGAAAWLYRQVSGADPADEKTPRQFLARVARGDRDTQAALAWALSVGTSRERASRGRVR